MFKNFLVVFIFVCYYYKYTLTLSVGDTVKSLGTNLSPKSDTSKASLISVNSNPENISDIAESLGEKHVVNIYGHNIYYIGQQIVYSCNEINRSSNSERDNDDNNKSNKNNCDNKGIKLLPEGYRITPGIGAHKLHLQRVTWNNARKTCISEGGQLATITSESERKLFVRMLQETNRQGLVQAWLGVHELFGGGDWVTVNGDPFVTTEYAKWATTANFVWGNQPDNLGGHQDCMSIISGEAGALDDENCNMLNIFFCKITA